MHTTQLNHYERGLFTWLIITLFFQVTDFIRDVSNLSHLVAVILNYAIYKELTMYNVYSSVIQQLLRHGNTGPLPHRSHDFPLVLLQVAQVQQQLRR